MASRQTRSKSSVDPVGSPVVRLEIYDVEKVRGVSNYYLYVIQATCKNGSHYTIRRRYRQFDEMYKCLEKRFPIEAGFIKAKERTLPDLPGKVFFGRSAVKEVTAKRLPVLNNYLQSLMSLPDKIRYDSIVQNFTRPTPEDIQAPPSIGLIKAVAPTKPAPPTKPTTSKPAPASLRPPPPGFAAGRKSPPARPEAPTSRLKDTKGPRARALYSYSGQYSDELSFTEGAEISLIRRKDADWWEGQLGGRSGLVPSNYIEVIQHPVQHSAKDAVQSSDEWDSSDEEERGKITYYFNGAARTMDVEQGTVRDPKFIALLQAIQKHLHRRDIVLNYKDKSGDLVELIDNDDIELLKTEAIPPRKSLNGSCHAPWALYVTVKNDHSQYRRQQAGR